MTAAESPWSWEITVTSWRRPHSASCSRAAARKVSPAASSTEHPSDWKSRVSLAMVVVLPAPFTPASRMMKGFGRSRASAFFERREEFRERLLELAFELGAVDDALVARRRAQRFDQLRRGRDADVGCDELRLELLEEGLVDLRMRAQDA
jgi:hypothetical protein